MIVQDKLDLDKGLRVHMGQIDADYMEHSASSRCESDLYQKGCMYPMRAIPFSVL